jgi:hypothetical protein
LRDRRSPAPAHHRAAALFVQTDDVHRNAIVAYGRGILDGSVGDHLASQGSLAYDAGRRLLYAVNAGDHGVPRARRPPQPSPGAAVGRRLSRRRHRAR